MARLAFMTMVMLRAPRADALVAGFMARVAGAFAEAETAPGFIDRSRLDPVTGLYDWGTRGVPRSFPEQEPGDRLVHTLSLWRDIDSVAAYSYKGKHAESLRGRRDWCVAPSWPTYFAWWVGDDETPTWEQGYERFDIIHRNGASPAAFDFRNSFGADGRPVQIGIRNTHRTV